MKHPVRTRRSTGLEIEFFLTVFDKQPLISCDSRLFQSSELRRNNTVVPPNIFSLEIIQEKGDRAKRKVLERWIQTPGIFVYLWVVGRCWRLPRLRFEYSEQRIRQNVSKIVKQSRARGTVSHCKQCTLVRERSGTTFTLDVRRTNIDTYHWNTELIMLFNPSPAIWFFTTTAGNIDLISYWFEILKEIWESFLIWYDDW